MPGPWFYVDEGRTHEVRVCVRDAGQPQLVVREAPFGSKREEDAHTHVTPLADAWEWRVHLLALETRLTRLGRYWRAEHGKPGWAPVRLAGAQTLDLTPARAPGRNDGLEFHHFDQTGAGGLDMTLVGIPRDTPAGRRWLLARMERRSLGKGEPPEVHVVHRALSPTVYRSLLAAESLATIERGFVKRPPPTDAEAQGLWWSNALEVVDAILGALAANNLPEGDWRPDWRGVARLAHERGPTQDQRDEQRAADRGMRRNYDVEEEDTGGPASAVTAKKPSVNLDELPNDVLGILRDPRLAGLESRFLGPAEADRLLALGESAIRETIKKKRLTARADDQHLLSLIEAELVVKRAMATRGRIDPDTLHLLRHAPAYL